MENITEIITAKINPEERYKKSDNKDPIKKELLNDLAESENELLNA